MGGGSPRTDAVHVVVDPALRVRGVMPRITTSNTCATVVAIAEKR